jgi:pyruvate/2-oxoglutarate dehydrogenase complex dihydrolipoamide acyltransferase (E2) component
MGITEVEIIEWKIAVGDRVQKGDPLIELDVEKTTAILESDAAGVVEEILFHNNDRVEVGLVLCRIREEAEYS